MPVQVNIAIGTSGVVLWDGTLGFDMDIRKHIRFGFVMKVTGVIAADAVFNIESAMPDVADPCIPGAWEPVAEVPICDVPAVPSDQATITIPAGTTVGTICGGTIPCRPGAFVRVVAASGTTANVQVVGLLQGPKI